MRFFKKQKRKRSPKTEKVRKNYRDTKNDCIFGYKASTLSKTEMEQVI